MARPIIDTWEEWIGRRPKYPYTLAQWHMLDSAGSTTLVDDSGNGKHLTIVSPATMVSNAVKVNLGQVNFVPSAENASPLATPADPNNGYFVGGFFTPTAADVANTWTILATTRDGVDAPMWHIALNAGKPHIRLYTSAGAEQMRYTWPTALAANQLHFVGLAVTLGSENTVSGVYLIVNESRSANLFGTGQINLSTDNGISFGHMTNTNNMEGTLQEWFLENSYPVDGLDGGVIPWVTSAKKSMAAVGLDGIDFTSVPGQITLKDGVAEGVYMSAVIDLENPFPELGELQFTGNIPYGVTSVTAETQTSADGINFSPLVPIDSQGIIQSPNYRYIRVRLTLRSNDGVSKPVVSSMYFTDHSPDAVINQIRIIPKVYDGNNVAVALLNKLSSLTLSDEVNGDETLEFSMVLNEKANSILNEYKITIPDNEFYVRKIWDDDSSGKMIRTFYCEAAWYDLATKPKIKDLSYLNTYPDVPLTHILKDTGWSLSYVEAGFDVRDISTEGKLNPLELIRSVQEVWGGDIVFDNVRRTVSLHRSNINTGYAVRKRKNMKRIKRLIDTTGLITRIYPLGANDINIGVANDGVMYVENFDWFIERGLEPVIKETEWKDERFYSPYYLKERAMEKVAESSKPTVSYEIEIQDLSAIPKFAHEVPQLRTQVLVDDEDMNVKELVKIVSRELDLLQPWNSTLQLSSKIRELGDEGATIAQNNKGRLDSSDAVQKTEMQELMVFNYLQNSRADSGMNHWVQNGNVTIDNTSGVTGRNSFKLIGSDTGKQELTQTINPSTRDNYTLSAQIATEGLKKNPSSKVGIKVTVYYEDEAAPEEIWLEL